MAATEAMKHIISDAFQNEEIKEALNDIRGFQYQIISRCSKELLFEIEDAGFEFHSEGITSRREELKAFLRSHPECMSSDIETLIDKIQFFSENQAAQRKIQREKVLQRIRERRHKKKPIVVESSSSDNSTTITIDTEEEDEKPQKSSKKK